jgi:hypothetical protein
MSIEDQIAIKADEPNQYSANELLDMMITSLDYVMFSPRVSYSLDEITFYLDADELLQAAHESVTTNQYAIREIYIKTIQEMME